jgi:hypothetical protein
MVAVLRIEPVKRTPKLAVGLAAQAPPSFHPREVAEHPLRVTDSGVVAGADFRLAENSVSR